MGRTQRARPFGPGAKDPAPWAEGDRPFWATPEGLESKPVGRWKSDGPPTIAGGQGSGDGLFGTIVYELV